ncbi:hypothetical protein [Chondromyces crocatus]|uniref:Uncharacterized protein n=1 Tax=Chondromyces crocatus TaxID=52 RepID=A0A0K1EAQ0_CHOCO|nr:hypothetical protein [Chondromyces crocatus]AKT37934.1 uncharacterized protein CMC5_020770 [Chondromyces crocatus]
MTQSAILAGLFGLTLIAALGCGGGDEPGGSSESSGTTSPPGSGGQGGTGGDGGSGTGGDGGAGGSGGSGGSTGGIGASCSAEPPPGATLAPPPPAYSGGTCPAFTAGANTFASSGNQRSFLLVLPDEIEPSESLPVIFLWHWLGGSAEGFFTRGEVQDAVNQQRFIAVIPESKDDILFKWPFETTATSARMEEEFVFFDDMLSCVSEQFNVNKECVSSAGVSAGALFTGQLAGGRGQYLSSILSLSGGVGGFIKPWTPPAHKMPAMVLWGGPQDTCIVINFQDTSRNLETALTADGHFFLECVHNCQHAEPPIDAPSGVSTYGPLWQFALDHPYWLNPGESPYTSAGIPPELPTWCGIGTGSSTIRTGDCPNAPGC